MLNKQQFMLGTTAVHGNEPPTSSSNLAPHEQIYSLLNDYAHTLDSGRIEDCAALFADADFAIEGVATVHGKEGVADLFSVIILYQDGTPRTKHLISNVEIAIGYNGKTARAVSYLTVMQQVDAHPLQPIFSGLYADEFVLRAGLWAFTSRKVSNALFGDMSLHLTAPPI